MHLAVVMNVVNDIAGLPLTILTPGEAMDVSKFTASRVQTIMLHLTDR